MRGQRVLVTTAALFLPAAVDASGGLTDDERLLFSDGQWHRNQRKRIAFQDSCYYLAEDTLPYGCQYDTSKLEVWTNDMRHKQERLVLVDFYTLAGGTNWRSKDNWLVGDPCWDVWYGITCDEHGEVIAIELMDNNLQGQIAPNLGQLRSLLKLDLSSGNTHYHGHPNKNMNRLTGSVPSLAPAGRLEEIEVSGNLLDAFSPDLYLNAKSLRVLSASRNKFTKFPENLLRFTKLHTLELANNEIEDEFPDDLGYLSNVRFVQLEYNKIHGFISADVTQIDKIRVFDVSHNIKLEGEVPREIITQWPMVDYIAIVNTSISGYISSLCIDVAYCRKFRYDAHGDLSESTQFEIPDLVAHTFQVAKSADELEPPMDSPYGR